MALPIYIRIQQYIRNKIASGDWLENDMIPTESELGRMFGCSRLPVTTALRELAKDGVVRRVQGKGTFVAKPPESPAGSGVYERDNILSRSLYSVSSLTLPGEHKCLGVAEEMPGREIAETLRLGPAQLVIRIDRVKYVGGKAAFLEKVYLPQRLYAPVPREEMREGLVADFSQKCGILLGKSYISGEPVLCGTEAALTLGIAEGSPIMRFLIQFDDIRGAAVACEVIYTRGKQEKTLFTI